MKPKINVMIDLETLGVGHFATIISLGAVWFDNSGMREAFHIAIDPINSATRGLRMDPSTVMWWLQPDQAEPWKSWYEMLKFPLAEALAGFQEWLLECLKKSESDSMDGGPLDHRETYVPWEQVILWGNGPQFDCSLLRDAYRAIGTHEDDIPWRHFNERCFRTMKALPGAKGIEPKFDGLKHNALMDARHQALWLIEIQKRISDLGSISEVAKPW